jgi:hypothetical protein
MAKTVKNNEDKTAKTSFMLRPSINRKMKFICLQDSNYKTPSVIIDQALNEFIAKWEKKNGAIQIK